MGSFNDSLHVFAPAGPDGAAVANDTEGLAGGLAWLREHSREGSGTPPYSAYPARPGLIRWGASFTGDDAFWLVDGADPDVWPVVVWDRGLTEWITRPPGMVELLLQVPTAPANDRAMSMISATPGRPVRFVNGHIVNSLRNPGRIYWTKGTGSEADRLRRLVLRMIRAVGRRSPASAGMRAARRSCGAGRAPCQSQRPFRTRSSADRPAGPQFGLPPGRPQSPFWPISIKNRLFIAASPRARRIVASSAWA